MIQCALYVGRVSKWGSRIVQKNGRDCLEFDVITPSQTIKPDGFRQGFYVRVSAWGPQEGTIDKAVKKGDLVLVKGLPSNLGRANAIMAFTKDIAVGENEILNYFKNLGDTHEEE